MKKINLLLLTFLGIFGCVFTACDDDESNVAKAVLATVSSVTFDGEGAPAQVLTVYSDAVWTVSDCPEWLTVEPTTGTGTTEVSISVTDNMRDGALDKPRYADLVFKGATKASEAHVSITQAGDIFRDVQPITVDEAEAVPDKEGIIINNVTVQHLTASGFIGTSGTRNLFVTAAKDKCPAVGACVNLYATKGSDDNSYAVFTLDHTTAGTTKSELASPVDITEQLDSYNGMPREYVTLTGKVKGKDIIVEGASNQGYVVETGVGVEWNKFSEHKVTVRGYYGGTASPAVRLLVVEVDDLGADVNYVFFEDFEWLEPWSCQKPAGQTVETNNPDATAQQLGTNKVDVDGQEVSTYEALLAQGYDFVITHHSEKSAREAKAQIYLQRNYLKFGLTGYYSGLVLKPIEKVPANAHLVMTFDWSSQRQGSGKWDPTKLVVIVKNGDTETSFEVPEYNYVDEEEYKWIKAEIDLGTIQIDKETKITIRNCDAQWPSTAEKADALRWFIDNIGIIAK